MGSNDDPNAAAKAKAKAKASSNSNSNSSSKAKSSPSDKSSPSSANGLMRMDSDSHDRTIHDLSTSDLYDLIELAVESKLSNLNLLPEPKDNDASEDDGASARSPLERAQARARAQHFQEIHLDSNGRPESPLSQASEPHDVRRPMPFVQLQPNVGSETDLAGLDGYGLGFEPPLSPRSTTSTTRRMHKRATDDGSLHRSQSLNRHTSNSSHTQLPALTLNMPKHMQLQHQHSLPSRKPSTDSFICGINDCDPRCWIVAAGLLEKKRDGKLRDGWAKRFFVLKKDRLFYFLTARKDTRGDDVALLGEERGVIKMVDIEDVATGAGSDGWYIYMNLAKQAMRKSSAFQQGSSTLTLRVKTQAIGEAWAAALQQTRSEALSRAIADGDGQNVAEMLQRQSSISVSLSEIGGRSAPPTPDNSGSSAAAAFATRRFYSSSYASAPAVNPSPLYASERSLASRVGLLVTEGLDESGSASGKKPVHTRMSPMIISSLVVMWQAISLYGPETNTLPHWLIYNFCLFLFIWHYQALAIEYDTTFTRQKKVISGYRSSLEAIKDAVEEAVEARLQRGSDLNLDEDTDDASQPLKGDDEDEVEEEKLPLVESPVAQGAPIAGQSGLEAPKSQWRPNSFSIGDASKFKVRDGPNYKKNHIKNPSQPSLYDVVAVDVFRGDEKVEFAMDHFHPPPARDCDDLAAIKRTGLPRIVVMHIQVSLNDPLNLWGGRGNDPGVSMVQYFAIKPETVEKYNGDESKHTSAMKLWKRYVTSWKTDEDVRRRLKGIGVIDNLAEFGTLAKFEGYNGKPFILNKTVQRKVGEDYLEIAVDVRKFAFFAKKMTYSFMDYTKKLQINMGIVVQAEADEEMPEGIVLVSQLHHLDLKEAAHLNTLVRIDNS